MPTNGEVKKLSVLEELLWVLQQQACYLAQLSMCIQEGEEAQVFYRIVDRSVGGQFTCAEPTLQQYGRIKL